MPKLKRVDKLRRSRQIIRVFTKYGLNYLFDQNKIGILTKLRKRFHVESKLSPAVKFCFALEELGPTFIKFGQILSTRPDLLPPSFIKELEKLQDQSPPFDSIQAQEIIVQELNMPIEKLFKKFEPKPVAAASLSQVHKATLFNGEIAAIKIQRPVIKEIIELDLAILEYLAGFVENRFHNGWNYQPRLMVKEFKKAIRKELDFTKEAHNFEKFRINFKDVEYIRVPKVYWEMTTPVLLTMEFIEGTKINEITCEQYKDVFNPAEVAKRGAKAILKQIFEDGFFHADPHPANLFIQPPANIIMLDVGMVGRLDKSTCFDAAKLLHAVVNRDADKALNSFENLKIIVKEVDRNLLRQDLTELFDSYLGTPLKDLEFKKVSHDILEIVFRHNLTLPPNLVLMIKALSMIESTGKSLYPDLDILTIAKPFVKNVSQQKLHPQELFKKSETILQDSIELIEQLPQDISVILHKAKEGKLKFIFENQDLEKITKSINNSGNRISLSLIIAALFIGSSLILLRQQTGPVLFGYPALGIIGYSIAIILSLLFIISFFKK